MTAKSHLTLEVHDWRSFSGWNPFPLMTSQRNAPQARGISRSIVDYQRQFPGRPVHLFGHSAGAGMVLFVLQQLPANVSVATAVLLAAAVSRDFDVHELTIRTHSGIWNFWSRGDLPTVGVGTLIFGTMDRRHAASAGALGFRHSDRPALDRPTGQLHDVGYRYAMARCWNFGGHFGCTNAAFVSRYIAPVLAGSVRSVQELHRC